MKKLQFTVTVGNEHLVVHARSHGNAVRKAARFLGVTLQTDHSTGGFKNVSCCRPAETVHRIVLSQPLVKKGRHGLRPPHTGPQVPMAFGVQRGPTRKERLASLSRARSMKRSIKRQERRLAQRGVTV